jgi:hypothetical protein
MAIAAILTLPYLMLTKTRKHSFCAIQRSVRIRGFISLENRAWSEAEDNNLGGHYEIRNVQNHSQKYR